MGEMYLQCAPMEGVIDYVYRQVQSKCFLPADTYYTPFLSPTEAHVLTGRELQELIPEHNAGIHVVPQLLGHHADDLIWFAGELQKFGYTEFNLNLGCPSGTVVKKKKGSGLLGESELLRELLDALFEKSPIDISIKTRVGLKSSEEFPALLELFNQYPIKELIIHPRITTQQYKGNADRKQLQYALENSKVPICYNGDLYDRNAFSKFHTEFPDVRSVMIGRGLVANPNLIAELRGNSAVTKDQLRNFHEELYHACKARIGSERPVLLHMKEIWYYLGCSFEDSRKPLKEIRKAQSLADYEAATAHLFSVCAVRPCAGFIPTELSEQTFPNADH